MTKEELRGTKIWFGDDNDLRNKVINVAVQYAPNKEAWATSEGRKYALCIHIDTDNTVWWSSTGNNKDSFDAREEREITPSQLLGETEQWEPKVGDWVIVLPEDENYYNSEKDIAGKVTKIDGYVEKWIYIKWDERGNCYQKVRLARPEEIPQEEVEYCELVRGVCGLGEKGKIYPVKNKVLQCGTDLVWGYPDSERFKPSTREAYEAQQKEVEDYDLVECIVNTNPYNQVFKVGRTYVPKNKGKNSFHYEGQLYTFKGSTLAFKRVPKNNQVNKCSTINKNENGTDQSERSKTEINLEANTGAEGGKDVRPRTKSVRNLCESGSIESGNEVNRTRKYRERLIPERGESYL